MMTRNRRGVSTIGVNSTRLLILALALLTLPSLAAYPVVYPQNVRQDWHYKVHEKVFVGTTWPHRDHDDWPVGGETPESLKRLPLNVQSIVLEEVTDAAVNELARRPVAELTVIEFSNAASVRLLSGYLSREEASDLRTLRIPVPAIADDGVSQEEREASVRTLRRELFAAVAASGIEALVVTWESPWSQNSVLLTSNDVRPLRESLALKHVGLHVYLQTNVEQDGDSCAITELARIPHLATLALPDGHTHADTLSGLADHAEHLTTLLVRVDPSDGDFDATEWMAALASITKLERLDVWGPGMASPGTAPALDLSPLRELTDLRHLELYATAALDISSFRALGALPSLRILHIAYSIEAKRHDAEELSARLSALAGSKLEVLWMEMVSEMHATVSLDALAEIKTLREVLLDFEVTPDGLDRFEGHKAMQLMWFGNIMEPTDSDDKAHRYLPILVTMPSLRIVPIQFFGDELSRSWPLLKTCKSLEALYVYGNEEDGEPPQVISSLLEELSVLENLRVLRLRHCRSLKPEDLKLLSKLPKLEALDLSDNDDLLTLESVSHLQDIGTLRKLHAGDVNRLSDEVLKALASISNLRELTLIYANDETQKEIVRELVREVNPQCTVRFE